MTPAGSRLLAASRLLWVLAFTATWFAWAWLNYGFLPVGSLAVALTWDARRHGRTTGRRPGLPHPPDGHRTSALLAALLLASLVIGFGPDWLVLGTLGVALAIKMRAGGAAVATRHDRPADG